jgi:hypothetical protein
MGYTLRMNAANRVGHGGGSGGPDIVTGPDGYSKGIAGVQSTFDAAGYRPGKPHDWNWATGINSSLR